MKQTTAAGRCHAACAAIVLLCLAGCPGKVRQDLEYDYPIVQTWQHEHLAWEDIAQFEGVPYDPFPTETLQSHIVDKSLVDQRTVLELDTNTGVLAILASSHGADQVVALDRQPAAVACARYNAARLMADDRIEVRLVTGPEDDLFASLKADERFDVMLVTVPQATPEDPATVDASAAFVDHLLTHFADHLEATGKVYLTVRDVPTLAHLRAQASEKGLALTVDPERESEAFSTPIVPGLLVELRPRIKQVTVGEDPANAKAEPAADHRMEEAESDAGESAGEAPPQ